MKKCTQSMLAVMAVCASVLAHAAEDGLWQDLGDNAGEQRPAVGSAPLPKKYRLVSLNTSALQARFHAAPSLARQALRDSSSLISLPFPDGSLRIFRIVESSVMEPGLAAKFPELKTYQGEAVDDPNVTVRLDWTAAGFHAMVSSGDEVIYIDPYQPGDTQRYLNYYKRDAQALPRSPDKVIETPKLHPQSGLQAQPVESAARSAGGVLRSYRIAIAATGEYTKYQGGTVAKGLSSVVTALNRVNGIYEKEVSVHFDLVANNDKIIYTNAASDPYSNTNSDSLLSQNQANLNRVIGTANYDIGHVFSTGGGGLAMLGVVCDKAYKAQGETGSSAPIGDAFWVDYVAHEIGHQFGGDHTFNSPLGSCAGNSEPLSRYEIGSGSTIMAYAGICGLDDLQPHSDPYFHSRSFDQIRAHVETGTGKTCGVATATANTAPVVDIGASNMTIPKQTPFMLTGAGYDADGDELAYSWEEYDLGKLATLAVTKRRNIPRSNLGSVPLFMALPPQLSADRYFPAYDVTLNNKTSKVEVLPNYARPLKFRLTARDNRGGVTVSDVKTLNVTDQAGPFAVTSPAAGVTWKAGSTGMVNWAVAQTDSAPVNCSAVDITLMTENSSYPLLKGTPNNGLATVNVPVVSTAAGRIKVSCSDNVFFALSKNNLTITQ